MILILLGTQNNSFHRLLEETEKIIEKGTIKEEVIVQAGYTKFQSEKMKIFDLIPKDELEKYQKEASLIITHGGVGSIITSIKKGKKVIAIPRMHKYEEHINDHQKQIVKKFNDKGYILGTENVENLEKAIIEIEQFEPKKYESNNELMLKTIEQFIESI